MGLAATMISGKMRHRSFAARLTAAAVWIYAAAALAACGALYAGGDRWWWAAALLYGPRWILAAPLAALLPAALLLRPRLLGVACVASALMLGPVLGFCVPWRSWPMAAKGAQSVRVLTCNLNAMTSGFERFENLLANTRPDVLVLEECSDEIFAELQRQGAWQVDRHKSLCVASRWPFGRIDWLVDDGRLGYWGDFAVKCEVAAPLGNLTVIGVHLETPREGLEELLHAGWRACDSISAEIVRRAAISAAARGLIDRAPARAVVAGDFNLPVESAIYQRDWAMFHNAFSAAGFGFGQTKYSRWFGIRIDHVLAGADWRVERCWLGPPIGSDHRPLLAELTLTSPS